MRDPEILLLSHAVERIINHDLTIEEDLTSLQESPDKLSNLSSLKKQSEKTVRPQLKIVATTLIYVVMGGTLVALTASALWRSLTTMKVSSSVVMQTVKPIITNRSGTIGKI
ncbi:MAG: hypothetical protein ACKO5Q_09750, partial [Microcystaceae cyanobacterium]